ncbi:MAG: tetratricopeptide repeat protein, partial [Acidobacteria bacterium]|nr:tetratricopeptide repeat protein [Acidobacteriota bacterium]
ARLERDTADQVAEVLIDLFETTASEQGPETEGRTVEDLLRLHTEEVLEGLAGRPAVQARMGLILGIVHRAHSHFAESRKLLRSALEQRLALAGWNDEESLEIYHELATLEASSGNPAHGQRMLRHSLDLYRALLGTRHESIAICLEDLAGSLPPASKERARLLEEALDLRQELEPVPGIGTASSLNALGLARMEEHRFDEALDLFRRSFALVKRDLGEDHPFSLAVQTNLAVTLTQLNRFDEAQALERRLVETSRRIYGPDSAIVANALNNLGASLAAAGRWQEAEATFGESLALARRWLPPGHSTLDNTARNLAYVVEYQGRTSEALALLEGLTADGPSDPASRASTEAQLAALRLHAGEVEAAVEVLERLSRRLESSETLRGVAAAAQAERLLGEAYLVDGRYREAERVFRRTLGSAVEVYGPQHPLSAYSACGLASALAGQRRTEEARALFADCLGLYSAWGWADPVTVATYRGFAAGLGDS